MCRYLEFFKVTSIISAVVPRKSISDATRSVFRKFQLLLYVESTLLNVYTDISRKYFRPFCGKHHTVPRRPFPILLSQWCSPLSPLRSCQTNLEFVAQICESRFSCKVCRVNSTERAVTGDVISSDCNGCTTLTVLRAFNPNFFLQIKIEVVYLVLLTNADTCFPLST